MPNSRLERARKSLPEGYQFGDAGIERECATLIDAMPLQLFVVSRGVGYIFKEAACEEIYPPIAFPFPLGWNVIEGEHHSDDWAV